MDETYSNIAFKLQNDLIDIITKKQEVNEYELIVFKYLFISELKIPLLEDFGVEINENSFSLYIIPDNLDFNVLRKLDDAFDKFQLQFMPNPYNILKLQFNLGD